jgi:hypothetical protein
MKKVKISQDQVQGLLLVLDEGSLSFQNAGWASSAPADCPKHEVVEAVNQLKLAFQEHGRFEVNASESNRS